MNINDTVLKQNSHHISVDLSKFQNQKKFERKMILKYKLNF